MNTLGYGLGTLALLHAGLPWVIHQRLGLWIALRARGGRGQVALTFDDGPDPRTTPGVLEALERHQVRATFFMLGERAVKSPALVREIAAAGHEVALHGYRHRHAWFRFPWEAAADVQRGYDALTEILERPPRFYRPPHGGWTWPLLQKVRRLGLTPVQWGLEAGDWVAGATPEAIAAKVVRLISPGTIVVMHDAGPGGAKSPGALERLLPELLKRGYRPRKLGDLELVFGSLPEALPKLVAPVEALFARLYKVEPAFYGAHSVFRLAPAPLPVATPEFPRGTPGLEIHLDSERMRRTAEAGTFVAYRRVRASMADLARALRERPHLANVEVIFGITLFWELLGPLGFSIQPLPAGLARRLGAWMYLLHRLYGGGPLKRIEPRLIYMPKAALLSRYG